VTRHPKATAAKPALSQPMRRRAAGKPAFPIVGMGASAGGLDAFIQLLEHVPNDTGMAFILVQHLNPQHESALPEILARAAGMPVEEVEHGALVRPNRVYVIPANAAMRLSGGRLLLSPRDPGGAPPYAIDFFFQSLAREHQEGAIGIVFSGNATDGTNGLEAIKAAGGITFAQDISAKYDSMPRSAIASGCVDYVMSPAAIATELARIAQHPYLRGNLRVMAADFVPPASPAHASTRRTMVRAARRTAPRQGMAKILELMLDATGVDFREYKPATIHRRVTRRMLLARMAGVDDYARLVESDRAELKLLFSDLLINVTSFFRDGPAFDALQKLVFAPSAADSSATPLRIWSIGCSSGQETYSLAMACIEATQPPGTRMPALQIFGTDLNESLLAKARQGLYGKTLAREISPERLRRFFVAEDGGYRVIKAVRELCIFARQDVLADPPFSRMDVVSCRNVLIYLEPAAQKRVLSTLHYALRPAGCLFLGSSETASHSDGLFDARDKKQRIFTRRAVATPAFPVATRGRRVPEAEARGAPHRPRAAEGQASLPHAFQEADRLTVNLFAPPGVLVDTGLNVLQFRGATGRYLAPASGKPTVQLLSLARDDLAGPLRKALDEARRTHLPVRREKVRVSDHLPHTITLRVIPLKNLSERYFLVLFEDSGRPRRQSAPVPEPPRGPADARKLRSRCAELEAELAEARDFLEALQQQHDRAHDELQGSHEELQSANEELQSINEELETSKEELESGSEELVTVNEEMAFRNGELSRLNSDLNNFHVSMNTAIVVLGRDLTIRRFTPLAGNLFNLMAADVGRPLGGIRHNLAVEDLEDFMRKVIALATAREAEVRDRNGHWYLLRARPYLTAENVVDGVVIVLLDIDALKRSEQTLLQERDYAEATLRTAREPLIILRPDLTVNTANEAFYRTFGLTPDQTENRLLYELAGGAWNIPVLRELLADVLPRNQFFTDLQITVTLGELGPRTMLLNGRRLENAEGNPLRILLAIEDISERHRSSLALRASEIRYRRLFESATDGVLTIDPDSGTITDANPSISGLLGAPRDQLVGRLWSDIGLWPDAAAAETILLRLQTEFEFCTAPMAIHASDGSARDVEVVVNLYDEGGRAVVQCNVRDVTERVRMHRALCRSEQRFEAIVAQATAGIAEMSLDGRFMLVNARFAAIVGRTPEELYRLSNHEITHPDDRAASAGRFTTLAKGHDDRSLEKRYLRPDGTSVWVSASVAWTTDHDDVPRTFVEVCRDISARRRAEAALALSEAYFRELTQNLPGGVWTSSPDGQVDFINRYWLEYTGQIFENVALEPNVWLKSLHPDDRSRAEAIAAEGHRTGHAYALEARFRQAATGAYRWYLKRSVPVHGADGNVHKRIGFCMDIEDLKQAQAVLADRAVGLETLVASRTGELRETISELETFSYSISHDMRAPLRALRGFAGLVLATHQTTLDAESVEHLRRINIAAGRMDALINDVLTYSRLLRSEIVAAAIDLDALVREVIATYPQLHAHQSRIRIQDPLPKVLGNETALTQCISNLLSNAVKFAKAGAPARVTVRAELSGADVILWIEDQGIGIDARDQDRIWNIFTRVHTGEQDGTGIGLAIVRKSIERMGGTTGVISTLGSGSRFWIRLRQA
jgi:two-component system CheB/CheR fusion protein